MWRLSFLILSTVTLPALAQQPTWPAMPVQPPATPVQMCPLTPSVPDQQPATWETWTDAREPSGTRGFSNFIGFMSNPVENIDPRSLTQIYPLVESVRTSTFGPLPSGDFQIYGAGINLALTDRLSIGLNQGGYAAIHFDRVNTRSALLNQFAARRNLGGQSRTGFLNPGGFAQYTLIADEECQFLFTAGLRCEVPAGSYEVFQGKGPAYLAPYVTAGKAIGCFHVLATTGYEFPARTGNSTNRTFNFNAHVDYQLCDWIYPLVEVNYARSDRSNDPNLVLRRGFFNLGNFDGVGEVVSLAVGVNFVLIRDRLEFGGCYVTPLYTKRDFDFDTVLVKMLFRF